MKPHVIISGINMKLIVADASSLILLGKCGLLDALAASAKLVVPQKVFDEVVNEDTLRTYPDAKKLDSLVAMNRITVEEAGGKSAEIPITLGSGEMECLQLFMSLRADMIITDDGKAIKACRYLELPFTISPKVVVSLFKNGKISFQHAREAILKLEKMGRYSKDIIADALLSLQPGED